MTVVQVSTNNIIYMYNISLDFPVVIIRKTECREVLRRINIETRKAKRVCEPLIRVFVFTYFIINKLIRAT